MKYIVVLFLVICFSCSGSKEKEQRIKIIPQPVSVYEYGGVYQLYKQAVIYCSVGFESSMVKTFSDELKDYVSFDDWIKGEADIEIRLTPELDSEAYSLEVMRDKITISAGTSNGAFYGLQTLRQLVMNAEEKNELLLIPCCTIEDSPRFAWRGIMLDESRHFFGMEKVKQLLDLMALHKLNIFHWHLTDSPGWRIEIKKYPKLATVGGIGNHTDPEAPAMFYSQEQIAEIVAYAADRYIQVVPEIDMPGHAAASNRAYPEFSGGGTAQYPEFTFNPGKEGTYSYLTDVLREVTSLFPSQYIHLGGDEVNFGNQQWITNPNVRELMKKQNLADLKEVEKYFVKRMADTVKSLERKTVGWDEILDLKLDPDETVVMWWRHDKVSLLDSALLKNYKVVLCPRIPLYFDFVQHENNEWGRRWKGAFCDLEKVYAFPPDSLFRSKEPGSLVMGIQANIWTEVIQNTRRLDFMTFPRLSAMAEAAWTKNEIKDYRNFLVRLEPLLNRLKGMNVYYSDPFEPGRTPEPEGPGK